MVSRLRVIVPTQFVPRRPARVAFTVLTMVTALRRA
jgi:hypothetical protein